MSKNAKLEQLGQEIKTAQAVHPENKAGVGENSAGVILARVVEGINVEEAETLLDQGARKDWQIIPVSPADETFEQLNLEEEAAIPVTPFREAHGVLTTAMFTRLLRRELLRLKRNGGCLSLVSAALLNRDVVEADIGIEYARKLEALLGSVILARLEACDSIGILRKGQYLCCLPGFGQLAARGFAEKVQMAFKIAVEKLLSQSNGKAVTATCALGIVNLLQNDNSEAPALLNRARQALEIAFNKPEGCIHQESTFAPLENTTLVQSSEKKFLFFGGDAP